MWSKNDQLAAVLDDRAEFVTRLSADPQFIVVGIEKCDHPPELSSGVTNVNLAADRGSTPERLANIASEKRVSDQLSVTPARNDRVQRDDASRHEIRSRFNQLAGRCLNLADRVFNAGERAEPVSGVSYLRSRNAGEKILRSSRKPRDFVRHRRAKNNHRVVNSRAHQPVDRHRNRVINQTTR